MKRTYLCLIISLAVATAVRGQSYSVETTSLSLLFNQAGEINKVSDRIAGLAYEAEGNELYLYDGRTKKEVDCRFRKSGSGNTFHYDSLDKSLSIEKRIVSHKDYISYHVIIKNKGREQKWLKVRLKMPVPYPRKNLSFWDGNTEHRVLDKDISRDEYTWTFPLCCVYGEKSGLAVGFNAGQFFSYLETGLSREKFYYGLKLVIDPGEKETIEYIIYNFPDDYGYLNALDKYYRIYSQYFEPHPNIDKNIYESGGASGFCDWLFIYETDLEVIRRTHSGWLWFYAPFKRAGDFFGREDNWKWKPKIKTSSSYTTVPLGKFLQDREGKIRRAYKYDIGIMFYIIDWCEWDLANEKYKDCITTDPDYHGQTVISPWVHNFTTDTKMFWSNNRFAEDTKRDLVKINKTYPNVIGFAVDCAEGHAKHRGAGMNETGGRAWDEKGVYINEQVGIGKMMDFIHTLKKNDGTSLGNTANHNGPASYITIFRTDAPINESIYNKVLSNVNKWKIDKYFLGSKPKQLYSSMGRVKLGDIIDWQNMSREEIRKTYGLLYDSVFNLCLYLGYYPLGYLGAGHAKFIDNLDILFKVVPKGWRVIPAMTGNKDLWYSRYGEGLNTYLCISNPTVRTIKFPLLIDNKYISQGDNIFVDFNGKVIENIVKDGRTIIDLNLEEKEFKVLRNIVSIGGLERFSAEASEKNGIGDGEITIELTTASSGRISGKFNIPENTYTTALIINDQKTQFIDSQNTVSFKTNLQPGKNNISLRYKSKRYYFTKEALLAYEPYSSGGIYDLSIVVEDSVNEDFSDDDYIAAWWISEYFRHALAKEHLPARELAKPLIKRVSSVSNIRNKILILDSANELCRKLKVDGKNFIYIDGRGNVVISGENSRERRNLVRELLSLLDEKYKYYGEIGGIRWFYQRIKESKETEKMREMGGIEKGTVFYE